jgi:hypothetical protein
LIGLHLIDVSHSGSNIAEHVGNVLDEWSFTDKIFSCLKDWELGSTGQQHEVENEELLSAFEDMFIDEDQSVASASAAAAGGGQ